MIAEQELPRWLAGLRRIRAAAIRLADPKQEDERKAMWRLYFARRRQFGSVQPAAALTIHKAQGSTYRQVFLHPDLCANRNQEELNRLAYVGISRAAEQLHVVRRG